MSERELINFKNLKIYCSLKETRSFTETAKLFNMTQSAVSHSIKNLEEQLGCKLFERINKSIVPKFYSEYIYNCFSDIIKDYENVIKNIRNFQDIDLAVKKKLSVATSLPTQVGLIHACINSIKKSYNNFNYDIRVFDSEEIYSGIENNTLDIGIVEKNRFVKSFISKTLLVDDYYLIVTKNHKWASDIINFTDLKQQKFVLYGKLNKIDECKKFLHSRDFIDNYIVCDDFHTTLTILNEVNGITIMPLSLINSFKQSRNLITIDNYDVNITDDLCVIFKSESHLSLIATAAVKSLINSSKYKYK